MGIFSKLFKKKKPTNILEFLQQETEGESTLPILVDAFERMCQMPIEGAKKEEEMILFETGTFSFTGQPMFYFSLVRQYPGQEEEYCQLHMEIQYVSSELNSTFSETIWDMDIKENIFEYVRASQSYMALHNETIAKVSIYMDET